MLPAGASKKAPAPVVLQTHGWGGTRAETPSGILGRLLDRGYAVMTWDSRGSGESGGEANIGAPGFEVADARALIDYLAARPEIQKDGPNDPRLGWIGGSKRRRRAAQHRGSRQTHRRARARDLVGQPRARPPSRRRAQADVGPHPLRRRGSDRGDARHLVSRRPPDPLLPVVPRPR